MRKKLHKVLDQIEVVAFVDFRMVWFRADAGVGILDILEKERFGRFITGQPAVRNVPKEGTSRVKDGSQPATSGLRSGLEDSPVLGVTVHASDQRVKDQHVYETLKYHFTVWATERIDDLPHGINRVEGLFVGMRDLFRGLWCGKDLFDHEAAVHQPFLFLAKIPGNKV
jgi:hypothetical protein